MKRPHLLRVEAPPESFAALFSAAAAADLRLGWLELPGTVEPVPAALAAAAELGALRAVAVTEGRTVVVKPRRGAAVLDDLLREHFRGTAVVLIHGSGGPPCAPRLVAVAEDRWRLEGSAGGGEELSTAALLARLRRPAGGSGGGS
jgi:hypothetical protein